MRKGGGGRSYSGNGGIGGSGVFGMFGSTVACKSEDTSFYCYFVKFFNLLIMIGFICLILYFLYSLLKPTLFSSKRK